MIKIFHRYIVDINTELQRKLKQKYLTQNVIEVGGGARLKLVLEIPLCQRDFTMKGNNICCDCQPPSSSLEKYSY
jgi:hypothetical protein